MSHILLSKREQTIPSPFAGSCCCELLPLSVGTRVAARPGPARPGLAGASLIGATVCSHCAVKVAEKKEERWGSSVIHVKTLICRSFARRLLLRDTFLPLLINSTVAGFLGNYLITIIVPRCMGSLYRITFFCISAYDTSFTHSTYEKTHCLI